LGRKALPSPVPNCEGPGAPANQVSSGITPLPTYDANGNQLKSTGLSSISWNAAGQPASVTALSGGPIAGTYDALGRLVETAQGSTYTQFVFSPAGGKLAVVQGPVNAGVLIKATIPLPGGETAVYNASGLNFIRHTDWLGSSRLATTWAHAVYSKESYAPFGETYSEAGTPDRSFTGQDQDTVTGSGATGIYDFLFRKYDPAAGRWLSPDPYGWNAVSLNDPQSLNRYAYVENQPMKLVDPNGEDFSCTGAVSGDDGAAEVTTCYSDDFGYGGTVVGVQVQKSTGPAIFTATSTGWAGPNGEILTPSSLNEVGLADYNPFGSSLPDFGFGTGPNIGAPPSGGGGSGGSGTKKINLVKFAINLFLSSELGALPSCDALDTIADVAIVVGGAGAIGGAVTAAFVPPLGGAIMAGSGAVAGAGAIASVGAKRGIGCW
jgi:RHS repeat-associated protein